MKKMIALVLMLAFALSMVALPASALGTNDIDETTYARLEAWLNETDNIPLTDWDPTFQIDITGDPNAETYRIYHTYAGTMDSLDNYRIGNRILVFANRGNFVVVGQVVDGEVVAFYEAQEAYDAGIIDDAALEKADVIHVYAAGDVNKDGVHDVADIVRMKMFMFYNTRMIEFTDLDMNGETDVGDILILKNWIMAAK